MQLSPLRGRKVSDRVRARGTRWRGKHMGISYLKMKKSEINNQQSKLFVGSAASTKLHKSAVKRNRMRRRCREALRTSLPPTSYQLPTSIQLIISPRSSSLTCDFAELRQDAEVFLAYLSRYAS